MPDGATFDSHLLMYTLNEKCTMLPTRAADKPRLRELYRRRKSLSNECTVAQRQVVLAVEWLRSIVVSAVQDVVGWRSTTLASDFARRLRRRLSRLRRRYVKCRTVRQWQRLSESHSRPVTCSSRGSYPGVHASYGCTRQRPGCAPTGSSRFSVFSRSKLM